MEHRADYKKHTDRVISQDVCLLSLCITREKKTQQRVNFKWQFFTLKANTSTYEHTRWTLENAVIPVILQMKDFIHRTHSFMESSDKWMKKNNIYF